MTNALVPTPVVNPIRFVAHALTTRSGAPWLLDLFCGAPAKYIANNERRCNEHKRE